jgi:uncharacterized membrane-anchored protein YitT (DUF2179 family)
MKIINRKNLITLFSVILSAAMMAFANNVFLVKAGLLPGGFLGLATLFNLISLRLGNEIPVYIFLILINVPVALFCVKEISKRFVFFSLLQVVLFSLFQNMIPVHPLFDDYILSVIFGGCVFGFGTAVALRGSASTGGTDFIALYVSNKTGREIWVQVFVFNCMLLLVFGYLSGWDKAGYSILFQFISTRMITTFHKRYKRVSLQIFTRCPDIVMKNYIKKSNHGITELSGIGGYTGSRTYMLIAVTSSYELNDAIEIIREADPDVIINVTQSEKYIGKFQQPKL